jgi:hypothetical protein
MLLLQAVGLVLGGIKIISVENHTASEAGNIQVLDGGGTGRHNNGSGNSQLASRISDTLCMVACRASNDTLPPLLGVQMSHLVVGAAKLEAEDGQQVLSFEEDSALKPVAEVDGMVKRALVDNIVDS